MFGLLVAFIADPFDPANNIALFSMLDRHMPPMGGKTRHPPSDPDTAWNAMCDIRIRAERIGGEGWLWPDESAFRSSWPNLTPRARVLVLNHDALHAILGVEQDIAGEYELATRLLMAPLAWSRGAAMPDPVARLHRVYGALSLCTLPVGMARGGIAPLRGVWAGFRGHV